MRNRNLWNDGPCDADFQIAHPSFMASFIWMLILTLAAVGITVVLSCVTPFAALAVALAATVGLRASLSLMVAVWLANQLIGFALFHFPRTPETLLIGLAIGGAAVMGTMAAWLVLKRMRSRRVLLRLGLALLISFAVYELALLAAVVFFGDLETFQPAVVAQLGFINAVSLMGMVALNEVLAALCRPWLGRIPRLARSW
ncbi:MAG TPA: hypothetical protein VF626_02835 [Chthoniobacterales bacterium]